jgi:RND family efflux transporter MFP subunit
VSAENNALVARREAERTKRLLAGGAVAERDVELADRSLWAAEAQLESARANAASADKQLQKTRLAAPFNGVVSRRYISVGDVVTMGNELFTVVDPRSMQLEASVPVSALGAIKVGSNVDFDVSGYESQKFTGTVRRVSPEVDPGTRQVRIVVNIPNAGSLVAGLFAKGRVVTEARSAIAVPITAVDLRGAAPTARRIKDGKVETVAVQLGLRDDVGMLIEVTGGLARGDTVLTGGAMSVAAGTLGPGSQGVARHGHFRFCHQAADHHGRGDGGARGIPGRFARDPQDRRIPRGGPALCVGRGDLSRRLA